MTTTARFQDTLKTIESFGDHFLVVCPGCGGCARVCSGRSAGPSIRFVCSSCGRNEEWQGNRSVLHYGRGRRKLPAGVLCIGVPVDWYFHYPVWLALPCCGETLWAYNEAHLDYLQSYVSATLRERAVAPRTAEARVRNRSLASRLPAWLLAAKNRGRILATLKKLRRERLPAGSPPA